MNDLNTHLLLREFLLELANHLYKKQSHCCVPHYSNDKCIDWPGVKVAARMGRSGSVMPCWDTVRGLGVGVEAARAWMGMGMIVFDRRLPSSLMAAVKAGTRTGLGN